MKVRYIEEHHAGKNMTFHQRRSELEKPKPPLTFLRCKNCGTEHSRLFKHNDYIFKEIRGEEDKCPKCGSPEMIIVNIYVPEEREKQGRG
ncbi:MAG TPA: hypothetical protein EYH45_05695 [Candidatus Caldiarchaeum subterraneum]|uniref:Uncharacterized protein n=1 Tax=Caldiarchaeum subterraneum TaxID=311458 RepID=A0A832ZW96_CALS0|nr:hypothetical protein [Aigarchaeota archaeon]HIQ30040.1 hypothetical protein [Candidatus Caldarchaeum subterraneum]